MVKEDDLERLSENKIIKYCYGRMPGNSNILNIIFWIKSKWSSNIKLRTDINKEYYGKYSSKHSLSTAFKEYFNSNGRTAHMTLIFNIFVIYTSFTQINCWIIFDSFNIYSKE